jgi:hypothetical protein
MTDVQARTVRGKACFDDLYVQPDPRAYYSGLGALDYQVPKHGVDVFEHLLGALGVDRPVIIDLCCSYGVNAALLKHHVDLADLFGHYGADALANVPPSELEEIDQAFFADRIRSSPPVVVGVDCASAAVEYAERVGILDRGLAENLEEVEPSPELCDLVRRADLVTVTGGVGYITERTFDRLLGGLDEASSPWIASLCLRTVSYREVADCLARHGLVTRKVTEVTFPQRRFATTEERDFALAQLAALDIDPTGKESAGWYHVDAYLSYPPSGAGVIDHVLREGCFSNG